MPGSILLLGEANPQWACTYAVQMRVPDVPAGTYTVLGLESGGDGAALLGQPFTFDVTAS